jgi:hypothetical protein
MLVGLVLLVVAGLAQSEAKPDVEVQTSTFSSSLTSMQFKLMSQMNPQPVEFQDPKEGLTYIWWTYGFAHTTNLAPGQFKTRFAVFCQPASEIKRCQQVARLLLRLYEMCNDRLKLNHTVETPFVNVFLSWGGTKTGGQQLYFTPSNTNGPAPRLSLIYIYQTSTLNNPVEWVREVAHEYGHAILPEVKGYTTPEGWATGLMGERLFIRWIIEGMEAGKLTTEDTIGATLPQLKAWEAKYIDPFEQVIWQRGLNIERLNGKDKAAMLEYVGLALYAQSAYGNQILTRAMKASGGVTANDFLNGLKFALDEQKNIKVKLPVLAHKAPVYLFLPGKKWSAGPGVIISEPVNGWVKVKTYRKLLTLTFSHKPAD